MARTSTNRSHFDRKDDLPWQAHVPAPGITTMAHREEYKGSWLRRMFHR